MPRERSKKQEMLENQVKELHAQLNQTQLSAINKASIAKPLIPEKTKVPRFIIRQETKEYFSDGTIYESVSTYNPNSN